ncbi:MAG: ArnT family glycosyltransferase [Nannocystales bacterium]
MSEPSDASPKSEEAPTAPPLRSGFLSRLPPDRRFLLLLLVLGLASRFAWVLWIHPPVDYVFSDMAKYVHRAQALAEDGFVWGDRTLAWQAWGTHYILAIPLRLFGKDNLVAGSVLWGMMGALTVPLAYLVGCRVCSTPLLAKIVGVAALVWLPSLSNSGSFLSETPFLFFQLWSTYWLLCTLQDGKRALGAGLVSAVALAVRPQSALFFLLVFIAWLVNIKRLRHVRWFHLVAIAAPIIAMLGFSMWRFEQHTGYGPGVAENANMNLTAARCHNIVTQAFRTEAHKKRSERRKNTRDGRRVSLPGYRLIAKRVPDDSLLGLRPALGGQTIRMVGYIGDPEIHREIRNECYEQTGVVEQVRYSMVNMSLLWFVGQQWPEKEKGRKWFLPPVEGFKHLYQVAIWIPSLIGMVWFMVWIRRRPSMSLIAFQTFTSTAIAGLFFGSIRLRTPYDIYAIILAAEVFAVVYVRVQAYRAAAALKAEAESE